MPSLQAVIKWFHEDLVFRNFWQDIDVNLRDRNFVLYKADPIMGPL